MAERTRKKISRKNGEDVLEFSPVNEVLGASSPVRAERPERDAAPVLQLEAPEIELDSPGSELPIAAKQSPEFLELATPKLPTLQKRNLARLLMQSPNRLYFYWSIGKNPFHTLSRALGQPGNYALVLKLIDLRTGEETIRPVEEKGNWWFDVDADGEFRAEIGFYSVSRPYIRVLYSNTVATPRKSPSPRTADTAEWRVPAQKFARVLDAAGFARDAFDVALAGDDIQAADAATRSAFAEFTGRPHNDFAAIAANELRYAMLALASGIALAELRGLVSERLFAFLSAMAEASAANALAALKDKFDFDADEFEIEEEAEATILGSRVAFPRRTRKARRPGLFDLPGPHPLSSATARPTSGGRFD